MMTIQWFPGHMAKAQREIKEKMKDIDLVFELVDARLPYSSSNPQVKEIIADKPVISILNKADLADDERTQQWLAWYHSETTRALAVDSKTGTGLADISQTAQTLQEQRKAKSLEKGVKPRSIRALIVGIPNVGKSTLINRMSAKKMAEVGDRPAVTQKQSWIKTRYGFDLLDTPGILWPKFSAETTGLRLAATGAIKEDIYDQADVALFVLQFLRQQYPENLSHRYNLTDLSEEDLDLFAEIGRKRGCLMKGGLIDYEKTARLILADLRHNKLGKITFESPVDVPRH